jgi:ketosteroid isomerase-like protein
MTPRPVALLILRLQLSGLVFAGLGLMPVASGAAGEAGSGSTPGVSDPGADPGAAVDAFHAALHAGKRDAVLALLAPDVLFYEQGFRESGRDAYGGQHVRDDIAFAAATAHEVLDRRLLWLGDGAACVLSRTREHGHFDGQDVDLVGTETVVLRRAGNGWVIVHMHTSAHPIEQGAP